MSKLRRSGKSYSIDTIRLLQQQYGAERRLYFLIGLDAFLELPTWRDPEIVAHALLVRRPFKARCSVSGAFTLPLIPPHPEAIVG